MAVVTPMGLQVRIDPREVFATITLIRSGQRQTDVLKVLRMCDAIEALPNTVAYWAAILTFACTRNPWAMATALVLGPLAGWIVRPVLVRIPPVIGLAELWERYFRFVIRQLLAVAGTFVFGGWLAAVLWIVASSVAGAVEIGIYLTVQLVGWKVRGVMIDSVVMSYARACRLLGARTKTRDLLTRKRIQDAIGAGIWESSFEEYVERMPTQAVRIVVSDLELAAWCAETRAIASLTE